MMNLLKPLLGGAIEKTIDRLVPDKNGAREAKEELERAILDAVTSADRAQAEINKVEANSPHWFAANWRPSIGWTCSIALFYNYVASPFIDIWVDGMPVLEVDGLYQLVLGMLGMSGLRTWEKMKGVARK